MSGSKYESVWDGLIDDLAERKVTAARSTLLMEITRSIQDQQITPHQLVERYKVTRVQAHALNRQAISELSLEELMIIGIRLGLKVSVSVD